MKKTLVQTLTKINVVLNSLTDTQYADKSVAPFYSSIGGHVRHILDFYSAILSGFDQKHINLVDRKRDEMLEKFSNIAIDHVCNICSGLEKLPEDYGLNLMVIDDLGGGIESVPYTLGGILSHANSHAIHHYAIISYILERLDIAIEDTTFGYNPSSPRVSSSAN
jgi:uncharacterized damage-inducible protein DinB